MPTVVLLSDGDWVEPTRALLERDGVAVEVIPLVGFVAGDAAGMMTAAEQLRRGAFQWLVVTSPRAVHALAAAAGSLTVPEQTRVAAVGDATAEALAQYGVATDFVPTENTARALVAQWPDDRNRLCVLWPHSEIARPTVRDGMLAIGAALTDVIAYRTVPRELTAQQRATIAAADAAVISSGSIARSLTEQVPDANLPVVSFGPITTADARDAGLRVVAEARTKHPEAVAAAVNAALSR